MFLNPPTSFMVVAKILADIADQVCCAPYKKLASILLYGTNFRIVRFVVPTHLITFITHPILRYFNTIAIYKLAFKTYHSDLQRTPSYVR